MIVSIFFVAISSPQGFVDNKDEIFDSPHVSVTRTEGEILNFKCLIQPEDKVLINRVQWQFSTDNKTYEDVPNGVETQGDELHIKSIEKRHRGYYKCSLNNVDYRMLVRVKGKLKLIFLSKIIGLNNEY